MGLPMAAKGNGLDALTLASESIPGFTTFPQALLRFQFIAEGAGDEIVGRSPECADVTLEICSRPRPVDDRGLSHGRGA